MKKTRFLTLLLILTFVACGVAKWQEHYDLGNKYLMDGKYEEAILEFNKAIEIDDKQAVVYISRGQAYIGWASVAEDATKTEEYYAMALKDYETAYALGETTTKSEIEEIKLMLKTLKNNPKSISLLEPLYDILSKGNTDAAIELMRTAEYRELAKSVPENEFFYYSNGSETKLSIYPDKYYYFGTYERMQRSGIGLWLYATDSASNVFEGEWKSDKPNGNGTEIFQSSLKEQSTSLDGITTKFIMRCERTGTLKNGMWHGEMKEKNFFSDDTVEECTFTLIDGVYQPVGAKTSDGSYVVTVNGVEEHHSGPPDMFLGAISNNGTDYWMDGSEKAYVPGFKQ